MTMTMTTKTNKPNQISSQYNKWQQEVVLLVVVAQSIVPSLWLVFKRIESPGPHFEFTYFLSCCHNNKQQKQKISSNNINRKKTPLLLTVV